jgi:hypothetical protein
MKTDRKNAIIAGVLFITATITGIASRPFLGLFDNPDYLNILSSQENRALIGIFFQLIMAIACAGIAFWLYPTLKKHNGTLAIGSVGFRIMEAICFIVASIGLMMMISLSQGFVKDGNHNVGYYQIIGGLLQTMRDCGFNFGIMTFSVGAFMYYVVFYQSKLIPRWLSIWGIIGAIMSFLVTILILFGEKSFSITSVILNLPIGVQEIVLAFWLIFKGFNQVENSQTI